MAEPKGDRPTNGSKPWGRRLSNASIVIMAAAIGALGTLGGSYIANSNAARIAQVQAQHDEAIRRNDLERAAYFKYIDVFEQYRADLLTLEDEKSSGSVSDATFRTADKDSVALAMAASELGLIAPDQVHNLATKAFDALDEWNVDMSPEALDKLINNATRLEDKFFDAAWERLHH